MSKGYETSMASEFLVMSCLYRLGVNASLTLGNRKQVDIVVERPDGSWITIDVKGLQGTTEWPVGGSKVVERLKNDPNHFLVFVGYSSGKNFRDVSKMPEFFVLPSRELPELAKQWGGDFFGIRYSDIRDSKFRDAWSLIKDWEAT